MPELIASSSTIEAAGTKPKLIEEFVGRVNTGEERLSVARMTSPAGWVEPGQRPEFDECGRWSWRAPCTWSTRAARWTCAAGSPLLGNVMLSGLDSEVERGGHRSCAYADDVMV
jgi:hypothetical protein